MRGVPTRVPVPRGNLLAFAALLACLVGIGEGPNGRTAQAGEDPARDLAQNSSRDPGHKAPSGDGGRGEELYTASCVVCHGPQASGGIGPRLAGNPVLSNDQAFWKIVPEGRHVMPPLKGVVTDQQMADIRAWLQTLR